MQSIIWIQVIQMAAVIFFLLFLFTSELLYAYLQVHFLFNVLFSIYCIKPQWQVLKESLFFFWFLKDTHLLHYMLNPL